MNGHAYLLAYVKRGKQHWFDTIFTETIHAIEQGERMKEKGQCTEYNFAIVNFPPLNQDMMK